MRRFGLVAAVLACVLVAPGCKKKDGDKKEDGDEQAAQQQQTAEEDEEKAEPEEPKKTSNGFVETTADKSFQEVVSGLEKKLKAEDVPRLVATVDHAKNARSADMELAATTLYLYSHPEFSAPLLKGAETAGLDLPQKILVWETDGGAVKVGFNAPDYVAARHGIDKYGLFRNNMGNEVTGILEEVAGAEFDELPETEVIKAGAGDGVVLMESDNSVDRTFKLLKEKIEENAKLSLITTVDHTAVAKKVGKQVSPIRLIIFGNPSIGTKLMQQKRSIGVDLPMKYLVYETQQGEINVAFNDPAWLSERHGIDADEELLEKMERTLEKIAAKATKETR